MSRFLNRLLLVKNCYLLLLALDFFDPDVSESNVLTMLLELETAGFGSGLDAAVDLLDLGVVVHLDAVPVDS